MNEKVLKLVDDKDFAEKVFACKDATEFSSVLAEYNVDLEGADPETAYAQFKTGINESKAEDGKELSETDLTAVSGGAIKGLFYWIGYGIGKLFQSKTGGVCY